MEAEEVVEEEEADPVTLKLGLEQGGQVPKRAKIPDTPFCISYFVVYVALFDLPYQASVRPGLLGPSRLSK